MPVQDRGTAPAAPPPRESKAPEPSSPETRAPETRAPETRAPETKAPETRAPETRAPETKAPETKAPETKAPETRAPETRAPETKAPETRAPETRAPETRAPETGKTGLFSRLRQGLSKTSSTLTEGMAGLVLGKKAIDDELMEELETRLLMADVGIEATERILDHLTRRVARKELNDAEALVKALEGAMVDVLEPVQKPLAIDRGKKPYVILVLGINGSGKTTTIGKLTHHLRAEGHSVMLAAGDTFRAAAVEQLQTWGERNQAPVIAQGQGADSASVIYDALEAARARGTDVLIADTAGRLHTQTNLMDELKKVKRVIQRQDAEAPHEVLLVVDAGTGQNALNQARDFHEAMGLTGLAVTKLDGTAKGGILFAIAERVGVPVRFIGVGEGIEDLREFNAADFARALLGERE
ncbi:signal recognition particle-docking protein FtsY [Ectothiorhodospira mobilis]|uniref:signal recognition particle-docking protein FtsY n=1 Tax=Ectothiorhodospira mobilis TaxID=195064 RepID=UPI001FD10521|nr:signal recognition particle-docking protein FtsY [Ectothiorhodospira mobilis]